MIRLVYASFFLLIGTSFLFGQNIPSLQPNKSIESIKEGEWVIWYTKNWQQTDNRDSVAYYRKIKYKNGQPDGIVRDYFLSGNVQWEGQLISDNPDVQTGLSIWYYENGHKNRSCNFINGKEEGQDTSFYENGNVLEIYNYTNGLKDGKSYTFYENGNRNIEAEFEKGLLTGQITFFLKDGSKDRSEKIENTWSELLDHVTKLYEMKFYEESIIFANRALELVKNEFGEDHPQFNYILNYIVSTYSILGQYEKALPFLLKIKEKTEKTYGENSPEYGRILKNLASLYQDMGSYDIALSFYLESLKITEKALGKNNTAYGTSLNNLALIYSKMGQYEKALPLYIEALDIREKTLGKNNPDYATSLNNLASLYQDEALYEKALPLYIQVLEIREKALGKNHPDYGTSLNNLACLYADVGQYEKALELYGEAKEISEKTIGKNNPAYGTNLCNLASLYYKMGMYFKALSYYIEGIEIIKYTLGKNHPDYGILLNNLACLCADLGQYEKALELHIEAKEIAEKTLGKNHPDYGSSLNNLAYIYEVNGEYTKAISLYLEALKNFEQTLSKVHPDYANILNNLALVYLDIGEFDKVSSLLLQALNITDKTLGKNHPDYLVRLNNLSVFYSEINQNDKAISFALTALENTEKNFGKENSIYGIRANNLASLYQNIGQYNNALNYFIDAKNSIEKSIGKKHPDYSTILSNLALLYNDLGDNEKALYFANEALTNTEENFGYDQRNYCFSLNKLALIYFNLGQSEKALPLFIQGLEKIKKLLGGKNKWYNTILFNIGMVNLNMGFYNETYKYLFNAIQNNLSEIEQNFAFLSEKEKVNYIFNISCKNDMFRSFLMDYHSSNLGVSNQMFKLELASKSMILNSLITMKQNFDKSNDTLMIKKFEDWRRLRYILAKQYSLSIANRMPDIDSLEQKANEIEGELTRLSSAFSQNKIVQKARWEDVQKALKNGEIAIEFSNFRYYNLKEWTDSILYIALVLRPQDSFPQMVKLCEQKQLDSIFTKSSQLESKNINNSYKNKRLYELIFKPLEPYLNNNDTIYYSPSGVLNQISFSAIMTDDSSYISDKYTLRQVSSTANILFEKEDTSSIKDIALFGGVNFDATEQEITKELDTIIREEFFVSRSFYKTDSTRSDKWIKLPGTLSEVNAISEIAHKEDINVRKFTGNDALEEKVKSLNAKNSPNILHIASHGFFFPDPKLDLKKINMLYLDDRNRFSVADDPMNRSGLLFAGCNTAWTSDSLTFSHEDGILTAYEASNISLTNTELVVLSACETGLGTIKGSEGVYGLQRAFKLAGAKYILMSLWKVPDKETSEFMTQFYSQYLSKKLDIRSAFNKAQTIMKEKYRTSPYKWAGFVLFE